ncbi:hypothetical protein ACIRU8_26605 [Streptomyces sp. NPDC101175]|uniref:hypothetical protein n=1 Tax=Streptomyces sp. NPDC101175 TaxID=3366123 RepID=UPI003834229B
MARDSRAAARGRHDERAVRQGPPGFPGRGVQRELHRIQSSIDLLAFCVVPFAGLVVYWVAGPTASGMLGLSVVEALIVVGLGHQVLSYARPSNSPRPPTP